MLRLDYQIQGDVNMKVSVMEAREQMKVLARGGATFNWVENSLNGSWLEFNIKSVYVDHVEAICEKISNDWAYEIDDKKGIATFSLLDFTKDSTKDKKYLIKVRQWLTRRNDKPVPMRTMEAVIVRETNKAVYVKMNGHLKPSSTCNHCGRRLTHPVSLLYGLGPVCGGHFHINPVNSEEELQRRYTEMQKKMEKVTWEGWIPKSQIESQQLV
jgi:hypothetical protein